MKNYRVLSLILALVMLAAVVFPAGVFADDFVLEDEVAVEDTAEEVQIEDEYLDEPGEEVAEPVLADDESEVLIDEDAALPEEESVNEEEAQIENEVEDLETSETDEFLAGKPVVTAPEDASAAEGATVTFKVTATGTAPLSYQWQTKLVGKTTWQSTKLGGYNTATLSFPMVASYDGRQYRCIVTDKNGNKTVSEPATLTLAKEIEQDGVVYEKLTDTTCTVKAYKGTASTLEIPKTINGMTVTEIGEEAFMNNTGLTSIKLPETITVIRARAFKGCTNLREMK